LNIISNKLVNISSYDVIYVHSNNQQTVEQWSNTQSIFIRLTKVYDYQLVMLTTDGTMALVLSAEAGYYIKTDDINGLQNQSEICLYKTSKTIRGPTSCTICSSITKSYPTIIRKVLLFKILLFMNILKMYHLIH